MVIRYNRFETYIKQKNLNIKTNIKRTLKRQINKRQHTLFTISTFRSIAEMNILHVTEPPILNISITESEYHTYQPFVNSKFDCNGEIRKAIQELNAYTLPS